MVAALLRAKLAPDLERALDLTPDQTGVLVAGLRELNRIESADVPRGRDSRRSGPTPVAEARAAVMAAASSMRSGGAEIVDRLTQVGSIAVDPKSQLDRQRAFLARARARGQA